MNSARPVIVWFRRDLRAEDNAALYHASHSGASIVPLFVVDTGLIASLRSDGAVFDFQAECLRELKTSLRRLGGSLVVRKGNVLDVHKQLIREINPAALYVNRDYEPSAVERDQAVSDLYGSRNIPVHEFKDHVLHEPGEVLNGQGNPYVVFTPYARAWRQLEPMKPFGMPRRFRSPGVAGDPIPDARSLRRIRTIDRPAFKGGESAARRRWDEFRHEGLGGYADHRNDPAVNGTSGMSPYLRFGCISPRTMVWEARQAQSGEGSRAAIATFIDELIWREFFQAVLFHVPRLVDSNYRQAFNRMPWKTSVRMFDAWKTGRTGFPLVDAGMRQLNRTGWMHNRVRMVVASFLTKDLRQDWKRGAHYFEEKLLDIETASNIGGWQWAAGTGVDPKPLRIFNPRRQSERFDPEGIYIRRHVPELQNVPGRFIHAPHEMPAALQKEIGCVIGKDYPAPIVDHANAAQEYKQYYMSIQRPPA